MEPGVGQLPGGGSSGSGRGSKHSVLSGLTIVALFRVLFGAFGVFSCVAQRLSGVSFAGSGAATTLTMVAIRGVVVGVEDKLSGGLTAAATAGKRSAKPDGAPDAARHSR